MGASLAELPAQAAHADVDDVRAGVEVVAPDHGQDAVARDHLAGVPDEVMQEPELAVGEVDLAVADPRLAPREVQHEAPGLESAVVAVAARAEL